MWNQFSTDAYTGQLAETTIYPGNNGELIHAYVARPLGPGPFPGVVLVHGLFANKEQWNAMACRVAAARSSGSSPR